MACLAFMHMPSLCAAGNPECNEAEKVTMCPHLEGKFTPDGHGVNPKAIDVELNIPELVAKAVKK